MNSRNALGIDPQSSNLWQGSGQGIGGTIVEDASANQVSAGAGVVAVVARGVGKTESVVENVAVPVELLRVCRVGYQHVRAQEAACAGQVVAGVHIYQPQVIIVGMAGVVAVGDGLAGGGAPVAAKRVVVGNVVVHNTATAVKQSPGAAQVVAVDIKQAVVAFFVTADAGGDGTAVKIITPWLKLVHGLPGQTKNEVHRQAIV